ncbi:hypothetical protein WH52_09955 [Tenacibaculum holothuriorum]|uniref:NADH dehydrogenase n=1 Tax=Tenacibaculum holothuriorum TaxID=1635173 RepID=A0A1Y2PBC2_9FLAO|nr:hypothetical protein [Tenacibaculum holothuriorum]OSY87742.1 hypothetical protein WH52_09955 [Tenacibaculum holothuriorum]
MSLIQLTLTYNLELFLWMLGAFLIGYFFAMSYYSKKNNQIKSTNTEETIITSEPTEETQEDLPPVIRAKKTVERGGIEIKEPKSLNFDSIGTATEDEKDDLTKIKGIGSFIEEKLNAIGIYTYNQISNLTEKDIDTITDLIQFFPGRIVRDNWKEQAKNLLKN